MKVGGEHHLAAVAGRGQPDLRGRDHARRPIRGGRPGQPDFPVPRSEQARAGPADRSVADRAGHLQAARRGRFGSDPVAQIQPRRRVLASGGFRTVKLWQKPQAARSSTWPRSKGRPARSPFRPTANWPRSAKRPARSRFLTWPTARSPRRWPATAGR